jgi:hypothetical protein
MILVGNQRSGAGDLARHLLKPENEHVEVHEVRGFACDDLHGALSEAYAISKGTRCTQFLFSLSLNPPKDARVDVTAFERAIEQAEKRLGLSDQPRAIVFHEKEGRRHAHAVWSRIKAEEMKAVQLSHTRNKLMEVSRDLYLEHGWRMPDGMVDRSKRDPRNFNLAEWQQAKRQGKDPRSIKAAMQDAWSISDSKTALTHALQERGYKLARGDRRGVVAVDLRGEVYALNKWTGVKAKQLRERIGDPASLPSVPEATAAYARDMQTTMQRISGDLDKERETRKADFERRRKELVARQHQERQVMAERLQSRSQQEALSRQARFRPGLHGAWDRMRGEHKRTQQQNEREAYSALLRDRTQKDNLIFGHLDQRQNLSTKRHQERTQHIEKKREIAADKFNFAAQESKAREERRAAFDEKRKLPSPTQTRDQPRNRDGPQFER